MPNYRVRRLPIARSSVRYAVCDFIEIALNAPTNAFGFLRVVLPSPERMNITGFFDLMGV